MSERVSRSLRRSVVARAHSCCEYCGLPEGVLALPHEPDHVIATQHGGKTRLDNLAYTCFRCNRLKGPNVASVDPVTGLITPLFNPRSDVWSTHFVWDGGEIVALTPIGRATVELLRLNDIERVTLRASLMRQGRYPFTASL
jgi:hypothetical protein